MRSASGYDTTTPVGSSAHRCDEGPVHQLARVVGRLDPTFAGAVVDTQRGLGQPQAQAWGEHVQARGRLGVQHAGGGEGGDRAGSEAHRGRRRIVHNGRVGGVTARRGRVDLLRLAEQHPGKVQHMGQLLDHLAAGAVPPAPPGHRGPLVQPVPGGQQRRRHPEQLARLRHRVQAAPVVAGAGDHPRLLRQLSDLYGHGQVGGQRLLREQRQAAVQRGALGAAPCERRRADVHRIRLDLVEGALGVGEGRGAVLGGQGGRRIRHSVDDREHVDLQPGQHGRVPAGHPAGTDQHDAGQRPAAARFRRGGAVASSRW